MHRAIERDESLVRQWLGGSAGSPEYPKIKSLPQKEKAGIYSGGAAPIRSGHHAGRTSGAKGGTPIVQATRAPSLLGSGICLISAVTAGGHMRFMIIEKGSVNAGVFIEFPRRLIKGAAREILLIADRDPARRATKAGACVHVPKKLLGVFDIETSDISAVS